MRAGLVLGEAFSGLRRNASMVISVVLVTFVSLTFVGAAMLMQLQIGTMRTFWADRAQVQIYMCSSLSQVPTCANGVATQEQIDGVQAQLDSDSLAPLISDLQFDSSEQVYEDALSVLGDEYDGILTEDQFGARFRITLADPSKSAVISEAFGGKDGIEEVNDQLQYLEPLFSALTVATYVAVGIAGLMLIAAVLLISTTIRLSAYARRRELGIMRLVGASNRFIQTPFILEGVLSALIGSVLASIAVVAGVQFGVQDYLRSRIPFVATWVDTADVLIVIPVLIGIGIVLAAFSAGFAIRRWLRA